MDWRFKIKRKNNKKYGIIRLSILIFLLIISILMSFESKEIIIDSSYNLETQITQSKIAPLKFKVTVEY